jgi:hypothetical protein
MYYYSKVCTEIKIFSRYFHVYDTIIFTFVACLPQRETSS